MVSECEYQGRRTAAQSMGNSVLHVCVVSESEEAQKLRSISSHAGVATARAHEEGAMAQVGWRIHVTNSHETLASSCER